MIDAYCAFPYLLPEVMVLDIEVFCSWSLLLPIATKEEHFQDYNDEYDIKCVDFPGYWCWSV
jgi:hypothetical protein